MGRIVGHLNAGDLLIGLLTGHDLLSDTPDVLQIKNTGMEKMGMEKMGIVKLEQNAATGVFDLVGANLDMEDGEYACSEH